MTTPADTAALAAALTAAAARLDLAGEILAGRVALIARQRDTMRWASPGARACRARVETLLRLLSATSGRLSLGADDLRRCAGRLSR
jgi:hypothetical protein